MEIPLRGGPGRAGSFGSDLYLIIEVAILEIIDLSIFPVRIPDAQEELIKSG